MRQLDFEQARALLVKYGIDVAYSELAETESQAVKIANKIGFPIVMKIDSPDIVHKTDAGCVIININSIAQIHSVFQTLYKNAKKHKKNARINGVVVQKQMFGEEIIIGSKQDPQFGPTILFGLGGIFVEVMKDVSLRIAPLDRKEALKMIKEIKGYPILSGARGKEPVDINKLAATIAKVSNMIMDEGDIVEMDLNPCFASPEGCIVADIRMMVR